VSNGDNSACIANGCASNTVFCVATG